MAIYHVTFIRDLSEDIPVLLEKGLSPNARNLARQLVDEFEFHLTDGLSLKMGDTYEKNDRGYELDGFFTMLQAEIDPESPDVWELRHVQLEEFLHRMQAAFEDGVAGDFEVLSVQTGGCAILPEEIASRARQQRRSQGKDLLGLSAAEVFDRTKRQVGEVALIASGEFLSNGIDRSNTAYAVGKITHEGLFQPVRSHLRYAEAVTLFEQTCKSSEHRLPAGR
jgi:hypothetical protein